MAYNTTIANLSWKPYLWLKYENVNINNVYTCHVDQRNINRIVDLTKCYSIIGDSDSVIYAMC